jgi:hypothetical protein
VLIDENRLQEDEIAVWGPTQSGKDWLFKAFAKELEYHNDRYSDFHLELREQRPGQDDTRLVVFSTPNTPPTPFGESYSLHFHRIALQKDEAHQISTHAHRIIFHNNSGAELLSFVMDPGRFEQALVPIKRSKHLLIILDPDFSQISAGREAFSRREESENQQSFINDTPDRLHDYLEIAGKSGLSKDDYWQILTILLKILAESKISKRHLAICITKTDILKRSGNNPWGLLEIVFGQKIYQLLNNYRSIFNIEVFATSAAGYYLNNKGESVQNEAGGELIVSEAWNPINCAAPFFWIFQNREIERIYHSSNFLNRENNLRKYIRYPPRRNI